MSNTSLPDSQTIPNPTNEKESQVSSQATPATEEFAAEAAAEAAAREKAAFGDILSQFEKAQHKPQSGEAKNEGGARQLEGTVISVKDGLVFIDIGYKTEGVLPLAALLDAPPVKAGVAGLPGADVSVAA